MPAKVPIRAGKAYSINGIPYTLITTKGKELAYLAIATESDGMIDGPEDVLASAEVWREQLNTHSRFDKSADVDKDGANSCPPLQASG